MHKLDDLTAAILNGEHIGMGSHLIRKNSSPDFNMPARGIEAYFNRPKRPWEIEELLSDIRDTRHCLAIASAWWTDMDVAVAFMDSPAENKIAIFSQSDLNRAGSKDVYETICGYIDAKRHYSMAGDEDTNPIMECVTLGSGDFKEGVMHHKFVTCDRTVVWVGSYNMTFQARNNYENILRIEGGGVAARFWAEAYELTYESALWTGSSQFASAGGAFRCTKCMKLFPDHLLGYDGGSWQMCMTCAGRGRQ